MDTTTKTTPAAKIVTAFDGEGSVAVVTAVKTGSIRVQTGFASTGGLSSALKMSRKQALALIEALTVALEVDA